MPPTLTVYDATFVSVASFAATSFPNRSISTNVVPCGASAVALSEPVSSGGNRPLGITDHNAAVSARMIAENTSANGRRRITHARLRS